MDEGSVYILYQTTKKRVNPMGVILKRMVGKGDAYWMNVSASWFNTSNLKSNVIE